MLALLLDELAPLAYEFPCCISLYPIEPVDNCVSGELRRHQLLFGIRRWHYVRDTEIDAITGLSHTISPIEPSHTRHAVIIFRCALNSILGAGSVKFVQCYAEINFPLYSLNLPLLMSRVARLCHAFSFIERQMLYKVSQNVLYVQFLTDPPLTRLGVCLRGAKSKQLHA